ncbi:MAG: hypothetical protein ACOVP6_09115, partial [Lacibacter sp.]
MKSAVRHTARALLTLFFSTFLFTISFAQEDEYEKIKGDISNEVYDLHFDKNGLLWLGHAGGISSYDGRKFRHYYNPEQLSAGMTGLCEDSSGRIWCYNFSGQIWYVEKGRLHLLKEYKYKNEIFFPRIGIFKNELIASTNKGFFIYNIKTQKSIYINLGIGTYSLAILKEKVILIDYDKNWFIYHGMNKPIKRVEEKRITGVTGAQLLYSNTSNEFYLTEAPHDIVYKINNTNNQINFLDSIHTEGFANGISFEGNKAWIHTKISSKAVNSNQYIKNKNISDLIKDKNGTIWFSSLSSGLYRINKKNNNKKNLSNDLKIKERVISLNSDSLCLILGTETGKLLLLDHLNYKSIKKEINLKEYGSVEKIYRGYKFEFLAASSMGLYLFNYKRDNLENIINLRTIKDVFINNNHCIFSTNSEIIWNNNYKNKKDTSWINNLRIQFPKMEFHKSNLTGFFSTGYIRTKSSCIINDSILFKSTKNGLFLATKNRNEQLYYENTPISANKLFPLKEKLLIASSNHGLLIWENFKLKKILLKNNTIHGITNIKETDNSILVFSNSGIFNFIPTTEHLKRINLNDVPHNTVLDIEKIDKNYIVATNNGLEIIPTEIQYANIEMNAIPNYFTVNKKDTITKNFISLSHFQNDLAFFYTVPWYGAKEDIEIVYRLQHN